MKITILGAGNVGATLGKKIADTGHEVFFGVPDPTKHEDKKTFARVGTIGEAAACGSEIILLAVPFSAAIDALRECGDLHGKIIVDATNPLKFENGVLHLTLGFETSGAEEIAKKLSGAKIVKCFNHVGFEIMANPQFSGGKAVMFICGDDSAANESVCKLADEIGFEAMNIGGLEKSRLLEPLAALWIHLMFTRDLKRDFAFGILRR
jgi:predicted dinucleotide-binding enzyme